MSESAPKTPRELHDEYNAFLRRKLDEAQSRLTELERECDSLRSTVHQLGIALHALEPLQAVVPDIADGGDEFVQDDTAGTHFERIVAYLRNQRQPRTIGEIEANTGIKRSSISAVLYRTHPDSFVRVEADGNRPNLWTLAETGESHWSSGDSEIPF